MTEEEKKAIIRRFVDEDRDARSAADIAPPRTCWSKATRS